MKLAEKFWHLLRRVRVIHIVVAIGCVAALAYSFYFQVRLAVDAKAYDNIAWNIVQGVGYRETTGNPIGDLAVGRPGPGYEFFLAFWYFLFGHHVWIIWIVQSLLHAASGFLIYCIIRKLSSPDIHEGFAVAGAAFYLFFIDVLEFPAMLMSETLFLFLLIGGTYFSMGLWEKPTTRATIGSSVALTLAVLVRPFAFLLLVLNFLFLMIHRRIRFLTMSALIVAAILTPWTVRNYLMFHRIIPTTDILGYNLWIGNNPAAPYPGELSATEEIDRYSVEHGLFATNDRGMQEFRKFALSNPMQFLKLQIAKTSIYFSAARPAAFWFHLSGTSRLLTAVFSSLFSFILFGVGLAGLWKYLFRPGAMNRVLVLFTLAAPASVILMVVETRYRYQIYPMLIVLGTLFVAEFWRRKRELWKPLAISFLLVSLNTAFDALHNISRITERFNQLW